MACMLKENICRGRGAGAGAGAGAGYDDIHRPVDIRHGSKKAYVLACVRRGNIWQGGGRGVGYDDILHPVRTRAYRFPRQYPISLRGI